MVTVVQLAAIAAILAGLLLLSSASECQISTWNPWSACLGTCLLSMRTRNRDVLRPPFPEIRDGKLVMDSCPSLYQVQQCLIPTCHDNGTDNIQLNETSVETLKKLMHNLNISLPEMQNVNFGNILTTSVINFTENEEATEASTLSHAWITYSSHELSKNDSSNVTFSQLEFPSTSSIVSAKPEFQNQNIIRISGFPSFPKTEPKTFLSSRAPLSSTTNLHEISGTEKTPRSQFSTEIYFNHPFDFEEQYNLETPKIPKSITPAFDLDIPAVMQELHLKQPQLKLDASTLQPVIEKAAPTPTLPPAGPPPPGLLPPQLTGQLTELLPQSLFLPHPVIAQQPLKQNAFIATAPGNAPPAFPQNRAPEIDEQRVDTAQLFTALPQVAQSTVSSLLPLTPPTSAQLSNVARATGIPVLQPGIPIVLPRPKPAPFGRTPTQNSSVDGGKSFVLKLANVQLPKPGNFILFAGLPTKAPVNKSPDFADLKLEDEFEAALPVPKPFPLLPVPKDFPISATDVDDVFLQTSNIVYLPENNGTDEDDLFSEVNYLDDRDVPVDKDFATLLPPAQSVIRQQFEQAKLLTWPSLMINTTKSVQKSSRKANNLHVTVNDLSKINGITSQSPKIYSRTPTVAPTLLTQTTVSELKNATLFQIGTEKNDSTSFVANTDIVSANESTIGIDKTTEFTNGPLTSIEISTNSPSSRSNPVVLLKNDITVAEEPTGTSAKFPDNYTGDDLLSKGLDVVSSKDYLQTSSFPFKTSTITPVTVSEHENAATNETLDASKTPIKLFPTLPNDTLLVHKEPSENYTTYEYYESTYDEYSGSDFPLDNNVNFTRLSSIDLFSNQFSKSESPNERPGIEDHAEKTTLNPSSSSVVYLETAVPVSNKSSKRNHRPTIKLHSLLKSKDEELSNNFSPSESGLESFSETVHTTSELKNTAPNETVAVPITTASAQHNSEITLITSANAWQTIFPTTSSTTSATETSGTSEKPSTGNVVHTVSTSGTSHLQVSNTFSNISSVNSRVVTETATSTNGVTITVSQKPSTFFTESTISETATLKFGGKTDDGSIVINSNWPTLQQLRHSSTTQELEPAKKIIVQSNGKEVKNVTEIIRLLNQLAGVPTTTTTEGPHFPCANYYASKRCCRNPTRFKCPDGKAAQMVMRWYRVAGQSECSAYNYGYCGLDMELDEQPIKFEQECYNMCYSELEKQNLPVFKEIHFDEGFRINDQSNNIKKQ